MKGGNESEISERKDKKERKIRYKERRVIKEEENARICLLYFPCLQFKDTTERVQTFSVYHSNCRKIMYRIKLYFISLE